MSRVPRPTSNSFFSIAVVLIAVMMVIPTAVAQDSTFNASRKTTKDFEVDYKPDAGVAWDDTINQMEPGFKTNLDTWGPFIDAHDGKYVGGMSPEQLIAVNATGTLNNITVAGLHSFTPHDVMGAGMSEGWVRSPIQQVEDAEVGMDVYHVQNPQFANLVPGLGVPTVSSTAANWTSDYNDTGGSHWVAGIGEGWDASAYYASLGAEAFYPFHGGSFNDFSGNGYNPTVVTGTIVDGVIGDGYSSQGGQHETDDLVAPHNIWENGGTITTWMKPSGIGNQVVANTYCGEGWMIWVEQTGPNTQIAMEHRPDYSVPGSNKGSWYSNKGIITNNEWQHIAIVYNKNTLDDPKYYVDGVDIGVFLVNDIPVLPMSDDDQGACDLHVGSDHGAAGMVHSIDEFAMWTTPLTQSQIQDLMWLPPANGTFVLAPANNQAGSADWNTHDPNMMGWDDEASTDGGALGLAPKVWAGKGQSERCNEHLFEPVGDLEGMWCFNEGTGTTAYDLSGNGHDAEEVDGDPTWSTGRVSTSKSLLFDGVDDVYETTGGSIIGTMTGYTVSGWYASDYGSEAFRIAVKSSGAGHSFYLNQWGLAGGWLDKWHWSFDDGVSQRHIVSTSVATPGEFDHVVMVADGATQLLYVNGVLEASGAYAGFDSAVMSEISFGGQTGGSNEFEGRIDEVAVYSTALDQTEVTALYNIGYDITYADNLVGQWLLGEGSGSVAYDTSGNANHGATTDADYSGGYIGGGMYFDGTGDYVEIADDDALEGMGALTVSFWIKPLSVNDGPDDYPRIISKDYSTAYEISYHHPQERYFFYINNDYVTTEQNVAIPDMWQHLAITYDGSKGRIYLNGVMVAEDTSFAQGAVGTNTHDLVFGDFYPHTGSKALNGFLDEIMMWSRSLSSYEIYNLYLGSYDLHENEYYESSYGSFAGVENAYVNPTTVVSLEAVYSDSISENYPGRAYMPDDTNTSAYSDLGELAGLWLFDEGYGGLVGDSGPNGNGGVITDADYCPGQYTKVSSDILSVYCMEEGTGVNVEDSIGGGNAANVGATWVDGLMGESALDFDGVNDYVLESTHWTFTGDWSVTLWFDMDIVNDEQLIDGDSANDGVNIQVYGGATKYIICGFDDGGSGWVYSTTPVLPNTLYHVGCTWDGGDLKMYINGVLEATLPTGGTAQDSGIIIGCNQNLIGSVFFDGTIDDVTISETTLSAAEILELYELTDRRSLWTTGVQGSGLDFDGGGDTVTIDDSDGTLLAGGDGGITWNMWVNPDDISGATQIPLFKCCGPGLTEQFIMFLKSGSSTYFYLQVNNLENGGAGNMVFPYGNCFTNGVWTMVTWTYDPSDGYMRAYCDGVEEINLDTGQAGHGVEFSNKDLCLGSCDGTKYEGQMDEVAVWTEALSADDILALYGMSQSRFQSGQMGYWPFDYGTTYPGLPIPMDYPWWGPECVLPCLLDHSKYENTAAYGDMWTSATVPTSVPDCRMQNNHCLFFDGAYNYVTIPDTWHDGTTLNPESITISHWIKRGDDGGSGNPVTKYGQYATEVWATEDCGGYFFLNGGWRDVKSHDNSCTDNVWHHVVITFNRATCTRSAYIDGVLKDSTSDPNACVLNTISDPAYPELSIGRWTGATQTFDGNIDEVMIWSRALSDDEVLELYDTTKADCVTYPLTCNPKPQSGHITHFEVWGSNTNDLSTATMEAEWFEGVDYYMSSSGGRNMLQLSATVPYYKYWWWMANMSNEYQSTPILHSVMLEMELFTQPYTLVPNPLSDPDLCWSNTYDTPDNDDLHEFYLDGNGVWGRHYLNFKCPIYAGRDVNADSLADDAYLFVFSAGGGKVNDTFELWLSQSNRGLDFMKSWAYIYDIDKLWMNDTLPLSLGSDVFFTRGMNHGITGWEMTDYSHDVQGTAIEFYTMLPEAFSEAEHDELTFHLPFEIGNDARCCQAAPPMNKEGVRYFAQVAGYTSDFAQTGITTSTGDSYLVDDTLLISGMDGVGADGRWDNTDVLDGATILRFRISFEECLLCHLPLYAVTYHGNFKVYSHDNNADFDGGEDSNFFNKFLVYDCAVVSSFTGCEVEEHIDFTVVHHVSVGSGMWQELTTGLTNNAPIDGPKYLYDAYTEEIYEEALICFDEYFDVEGGCIPSAQLTEYQIEYIENFNEWGEATEECFEEEILDFSTVDTSSEIYYCAKWAVWDTPIFIYETVSFIGEETGWTQEAHEFLYEVLGEPNIGGYVTFKEIYAVLNFQDGAMWEAAWLVGAFAEGFITVVVTVLQDNINQVSNFLVAMSRFMIFLFIMGSIIGSTSIIHHSLHGRWSIVNYKCATTLSQSAGFLSAVPFVGAGMTSVARSAVGTMNRHRPPLRKPAQKDRRTNR